MIKIIDRRPDVDEIVIKTNDITVLIWKDNSGNTQINVQDIKADSELAQLEL